MRLLGDVKLTHEKVVGCSISSWEGSAHPPWSEHGTCPSPWTTSHSLAQNTHDHWRRYPIKNYARKVFLLLLCRRYNTYPKNSFSLNLQGHAQIHRYSLTGLVLLTGKQLQTEGVPPLKKCANMKRARFVPF